MFWDAIHSSIPFSPPIARTLTGGVGEMLLVSQDEVLSVFPPSSQNSVLGGVSVLLFYYILDAQPLVLSPYTVDVIVAFNIVNTS